MNQKNAPWLLLLASAMWGSSFVASKICMNGGMRQFEGVVVLPQDQVVPLRPLCQNGFLKRQIVGGVLRTGFQIDDVFAHEAVPPEKNRAAQGGSRC